MANYCASIVRAVSMAWTRWHGHLMGVLLLELVMMLGYVSGTFVVVPCFLLTMGTVPTGVLLSLGRRMDDILLLLATMSRSGILRAAIH